MRKSNFKEEQLIGFLKQAQAGMAVAEICRKGGFSDATFYKWRAKFGGMEASDARRLRELEAENAKLKHLLAEAHLDMHALESVLGVKRWPRRPSGRPSGVNHKRVYRLCSDANLAVRKRKKVRRPPASARR